jgi:hypothetical protein
VPHDDNSSGRARVIRQWAVDLVAAEKRDPERRAGHQDSSIFMAEIRSTLAIMSDRKLLDEVYRDCREDK